MKKMIADMTGAIGLLLQKLLSYVTIDPAKASDENFGVYKAEDDSSRYFVKYLSGSETRVNSLRSNEFESWLCINYNGDDFNHQKYGDIIYNLEKFAGECKSEISGYSVFSRMGYADKKVYVCLHNDKHEVVVIGADGWKIIKEQDAISSKVLFESSSSMKFLPKPLKLKQSVDGGLNKLRKFVNVSDEDFSLVIGWLLAALMPKLTMDCPVLWLNAQKGTGKTTATKFLKRLIDPDIGGTISPVDNVRDFAAAASSRTVVAIDNVSKISHKMSDVICRAITGGTLSIRKMYTDSRVNNVNLHCRIIMNGINFVPERADLVDRCFQVNLLPLNHKKRKTNEELESDFQKEAPYILGALFDAVSAGLKNEQYVPELDFDVRMKDACQFILRVAHTGLLPFSENDFCEVLRKKKRKAEAAYKSKLYENTAMNLLIEMAQEKFKVAPTSDEVLVWDDSTGNLLKKLSDRALSIQKKSGATGILKDIPSTPQKLSKLLKSNNELLNDEGIYVSIGDRKTSCRITKIIYRPSDEDRSLESNPEFSKDADVQDSSSTSEATSPENTSKPEAVEKLDTVKK